MSESTCIDREGESIKRLSEREKESERASERERERERERQREREKSTMEVLFVGE